MILIIFFSLVFLMATGMPAAFCFQLIILIGGPLIWGYEAGMMQVILGIANSVVTFTILPLPLFILMGEVMFQSKIAPRMVDTLNNWLGRLPGRLSLLAIGAGTIFSTLTGASMASVAMLGGTLVPEMEERGYKKPMSIGPILGSGGLAIMIPPSGLAVLLGAIGEISIGNLLVAIIVPGLMMAALYAGYIILRCKLQPSLAPSYEVHPGSLSQKLVSTARYILPLGFIIFLVVGVIFVGIATPTEAAATGAMGCFILTAFYGRLNWELIRKTLRETLKVTTMMFMILTGAKVFSQILAFGGAVAGLAEFAMTLNLPPILIIVAMQIVLLILGMFLDIVAIMMITLPIFMPVVLALGFDPLWFGVIYLLNMEMATTTPPFGLSLFVMKGVAPLDTTMGDIYRAAIPFLTCDVIAMLLIMFFPSITLSLPRLMN
ncbi:TRAP transporter large permease subunit [Thermodesulfobacteriota bacterium]